MKSIKEVINNIPAPIGKYLSFIDFKFRLGKNYSLYKKEASLNSEFDFERFMKILIHAQENVYFYSEFYRENGFHYSQIKNVHDIKKIPIVTKAVLQEYTLQQRCSSMSGILSNTGGTTGQPLDFMLDSRAYAREWAHMHTVWSKLGYVPSSIKLTFRGRNLGGKPIKYFFNQNEFQVNAYCLLSEIVSELRKILKSYKVEYLHGYPSAIFEFISELSIKDKKLLSELKENLKGVFLASEFPAPFHRKFIENALNVPTISWYGHSEMAVLAFERTENYIYDVFPSYGIAEAVSIDGVKHLVATSLDNYICPFIRYDTSDIIEPIEESRGLLKSFKISQGRVGEFVIDSNGRKISLTALIFGRHHEIFSFARFVQIHQPSQGKIDVFVVTELSINEIASKFDFSNTSLDVCFHKRTIPKKTKLGKVPLLLKEYYETSDSNS